jgi:hypothetical protein
MPSNCTNYTDNKNKYMWLRANPLVGDGKNHNLMGGADDERELHIIDQINGAISGYVKDPQQQPINNINSMPFEITYFQDDTAKHLSSNCHLGQRKLLLTEMEFYTRYIKDHNANNLVVYAGSASCEHLPVILSMFKNLRFILIDPNYHSIDAKYKYIYQNNEVISSGNYKQFVSYLNKPDNSRMKHLHQITKMMTEVEFLNNPTDTVQSDSDSGSESNVMDRYNVFDKSEKYLKRMKDMMQYFYTNDEWNMIDWVMRGDTRVNIIQDYMTPVLIERLGEYFKRAKNVNVYFVTDIRTALVGGPFDIDLLWNSVLQAIFLKVIKPTYSMLKYRVPFFNDVTRDIFKNQSKYPDLKFVFNDLEYFKEKYQMDYVSKYLDGQFYYFEDTDILVQPWAPKNSSETRLFVSQQQIDRPMIRIDCEKFENRMFAFKFIREYKYFPIYHQQLKKYQNNDWDGCQDCAREIYICGSYLLSYPDKMEDFVDQQQIADKLSDQSFYDQMMKIYNQINQYTFFDLSKKNYKCPNHGEHPMTRQSDLLQFTITNRSTHTTGVYMVGSDGVKSVTRRKQTKREYEE